MPVGSRQNAKLLLCKDTVDGHHRENYDFPGDIFEVDYSSVITGVSESEGPQEDLERPLYPSMESSHAYDNNPSLSLGLSETLVKKFALGLLVCTSHPLCSCPCDHTIISQLVCSS